MFRLDSLEEQRMSYKVEKSIMSVKSSEISVSLAREQISGVIYGTD